MPCLANRISEYAMIDATIIRVHQHGMGAKGGLAIRPSGALGGGGGGVPLGAPLTGVSPALFIEMNRVSVELQTELGLARTSSSARAAETVRAMGSLPNSTGAGFESCR